MACVDARHLLLTGRVPQLVVVAVAYNVTLAPLVELRRVQEEEDDRPQEASQ